MPRNVCCFRSILDGGLYLSWLRLLTPGMNAMLDIWRDARMVSSAGKWREAARILEDDLLLAGFLAPLVNRANKRLQY